MGLKLVPNSPPGVRRYETASGAVVYQLPLEVFPGFWSSAYLALVDEYRVLVDCGSGFHKSNENLETGLQAAGKELGRSIGLADLTHILITHGHIDHFGGLSYVRERTAAKLGIHELDRRVLNNYEERLEVVARRLRQFLLEAGVPPERVQGLLDMYLLTKSLFHSVSVDFTYEEAGMRLGPFEFLHVPGHCAGHVVIRLDDILFSGDHVLASISPHQAPEHLTLFTGLGHYLQSLEALQVWAPHIRLTLGGHHEPVTDLAARLAEIRKLHKDRLAQVLQFLGEVHTVVEVSQNLFGEVHGYNVLLAIEEAGAHVEYLYQRGLLRIANLPQVGASMDPIPVLYQRLQGGD